MFEMIGMLVVAIIVIAIAAALFVLAVKIALMLLPVALLIGVICLFGACFCSNDNGVMPQSVQSKRIETIESLEFHKRVVTMTQQKWGVNLDPIRPEIDSAIAVVVRAYCNMAAVQALVVDQAGEFAYGQAVNWSRV